ncbi:hypothetical protein CEXT_577721 [Caerostris extrusa]|uniref:Uncharacterized protein n=1 Tax=Caerostris extrusa TaxID=172846 RepID=A0AAV4SMJ9_CAEEX|nr:hypothetical protein CEXT_577721 [Caerostris extrusa]
MSQSTRNNEDRTIGGARMRWCHRIGHLHILSIFLKNPPPFLSLESVFSDQLSVEGCVNDAKPVMVFKKRLFAAFQHCRFC